MPNDREQEAPNALAAIEYKLVTTLPNGREQWDLIVDSDVNQATQQAWGVLQEKDRSGDQIEAAKLECESPDEGPMTEYFYDRQQGIELSRPEGIRLSLEDEGNRVKQSGFTDEQLLDFHDPALKEAEHVAAIARELASYAAEQAPLPYVNAEAAMAENFVRQLATGAKTIDLTQQYATDDQSAARERHEKALENLQVLITETAQLPGYKVAAGHAIAEGLGQREVPAISHRQRQSMVA